MGSQILSQEQHEEIIADALREVSEERSLSFGSVTSPRRRKLLKHNERNRPGQYYNALSRYLLNTSPELFKINKRLADYPADSSTVIEIAGIVKALNMLSNKQKIFFLDEIILREDDFMRVPCAKILINSGIGAHLPTSILESPWLSYACHYFCSEAAADRIGKIKAVASDILRINTIYIETANCNVNCDEKLNNTLMTRKPFHKRINCTEKLLCKTRQSKLTHRSRKIYNKYGFKIKIIRNQRRQPNHSNRGNREKLNLKRRAVYPSPERTANSKKYSKNKDSANIIKRANATENAEKLSVSENLKQPQPLANKSPPSKSNTANAKNLATDEAILIKKIIKDIDWHKVISAIAGIGKLIMTVEVAREANAIVQKHAQDNARAIDRALASADDRCTFDQNLLDSCMSQNPIAVFDGDPANWGKIAQLWLLQLIMFHSEKYKTLTGMRYTRQGQAVENRCADWTNENVLPEVSNRDISVK